MDANAALVQSFDRNEAMIPKPPEISQGPDIEQFAGRNVTSKRGRAADRTGPPVDYRSLAFREGGTVVTVELLRPPGQPMLAADAVRTILESIRIDPKE